MVLKTKEKDQIKVVVGMSGGVDSSVAALLLKQAGYDVVGLFMQNWEEDEHCQATKDYEDVALVCNQIGIPFHYVNFSEEYAKRVFSNFLNEYALGRTPNPDILCNREIKFKVFYDYAREKLQADFLATGHYARLSDGHLLKARDLSKDQSYFLSAVETHVFNHVMFPLGDYLKSEVREIAKEANLATHAKKDSTGICFIGERKFQNFLAQYLKELKGEFRNLKGDYLGPCENILALTNGQRKGLGLGGEGKPFFVVGKDIEKKIVYVERGDDHPAFFTNEITVTEMVFFHPPKEENFQATVKVRYRQKDQACRVEKMIDKKYKIVFAEPQRSVTSGQMAVLYQGDVCLGGGFID